jgi:hypothetical protein
MAWRVIFGGLVCFVTIKEQLFVITRTKINRSPENYPTARWRDQGALILMDLATGKTELIELL